MERRQLPSVDQVCEVGRTRGIYELAISQPMLDMPEALWKVLGSWEGKCRQAPGLGLIEAPVVSGSGLRLDRRGLKDAIPQCTG